MKKNYFLAVSLLIAFAGCDNTEIDSIADNEQVAAEVSAGIDGLKTRVTDDSEWQTGDVIGIYGTSGKLTYTELIILNLTVHFLLSIMEPLMVNFQRIILM